MNDKSQSLDCICYTCANYYLCKICCGNREKDKHETEFVKQNKNCKHYISEED